MQLQHFKLDIQNHVALVTLDRSPVNAMDRETREEGTALFGRLGEESSVRAIILTGAGKMFSAGADLNDRPDSSRPGAYPAHNRSVREFFQVLMECPKPVIAAINGPAIGAGFVLASCCDILLTDESAWISMPEVEVSLAGGVRHILRHFGASDARLLMYTARRVPARELHERGVVSACVRDGELLSRAMGIAREIASKSPSAVRAAKTSFLMTEELSVHSGYRYEQTQTILLAQGEDFREAQAAFREKRKANFASK